MHLCLSVLSLYLYDHECLHDPLRRISLFIVALFLPGFTEHALYLLELDNTTCQMQIFDTEIFLLYYTFPYILVVHFMSLKSGRHAKVTIHLAYRCRSHKKGSGIKGTNLRICRRLIRSRFICTSHVKSQPITSKYFAQEYNFFRANQ